MHDPVPYINFFKYGDLSCVCVCVVFESPRDYTRPTIYTHKYFPVGGVSLAKPKTLFNTHTH